MVSLTNHWIIFPLSSNILTECQQSRILFIYLFYHTFLWCAKVYLCTYTDKIHMHGVVEKRIETLLWLNTLPWEKWPPFCGRIFICIFCNDFLCELSFHCCFFGIQVVSLVSRWQIINVYSGDGLAPNQKWAVFFRMTFADQMTSKMADKIPCELPIFGGLTSHHLHTHVLSICMSLFEGICIYRNKYICLSLCHYFPYCELRTTFLRHSNVNMILTIFIPEWHHFSSHEHHMRKTCQFHKFIYGFSEDFRGPFY